MRIRGILASIALFLVLAACDGGERSVMIETASGGVHRFEVELAISPADQQRGLMFRESLPETGGMLFLYERCMPATYWMKNTLIPLDMIFIEADGRIARIAEMTEPESLALHESGVPVNGVLEIRGGLTRRLGIAEGDHVRHPWFGKDGKATCG